jgi:hypothetical protein
MEKITCKEELLRDSLFEFFKYPENLDVVLEFIGPEKTEKTEITNKKLSLRLIDWFVTNYAKQNATYYVIKKQNGSSRTFFVYQEYVSALSGYNKEYFDPFRRGKKHGKVFSLEYDENKEIQTTLAQLNFFMWAIKNNVIEYVKNNIDKVHEDMNKRSTGKRGEGEKKKQLSSAPNRKLCQHNITTKIEFGTAS